MEYTVDVDETAELQLLVVSLRRSVDHDGYCSGDENGAQVTVTTQLITPTWLQDGVYKKGQVIDRTDFDNKTSGEFESSGVLDANGGSYYCEQNGLWEDLSQHAYADTVLYAIVV